MYAQEISASSFVELCLGVLESEIIILLHAHTHTHTHTPCFLKTEMQDWLQNLYIILAFYHIQTVGA
jgi:hypothetical protein